MKIEESARYQFSIKFNKLRSVPDPFQCRSDYKVTYKKYKQSEKHNHNIREHNNRQHKTTFAKFDLILN